MHVFSRHLHAATPSSMIKKARQKYDQEKKLHHSEGSAYRSFAVRLMHKIIEDTIILIFMLTAPGFQGLCNLVPMVDIVFWLGHKLIEHIIHVVTCCRLMTIRIAVVRRVDYAVVRMDIVVWIVDRAEKVWIKGGVGMGKW